MKITPSVKFDTVADFDWFAFTALAVNLRHAFYGF